MLNRNHLLAGEGLETTDMIFEKEVTEKERILIYWTYSYFSFKKHITVGQILDFKVGNLLTENILLQIAIQSHETVGLCTWNLPLQSTLRTLTLSYVADRQQSVHKNTWQDLDKSIF